jgi:ATP-dependent DNA ligase
MAFNRTLYTQLLNEKFKTNNFEEHLTKIFAAGGEGMVFKRKDSVYEPNKRPKTSFKYKEHLDSIDLICMNVLDPVMEYTGKEIESWSYWYDKKLQEPVYATFDMTEYYIKEDRYVPVTKPFFYGWKNAMQLGALKDGKIVEVCKVASGLNDLLRSSMADNPDNYIGQVVEIECMSVNKKDGTVRHPVFKRIREDKDSQDCLYNEIFS